MTALVSIVMPSLNQAAFIEESIISVLSQGYPNLELIVADGGSVDGTLDLLERRQGADPRLRYFSAKDSGPANALNKALTLVRGTVIGWLNSDDLYTAGAIQRVIEAFENNPGWLMVYGQGQHVDAEGKVMGPYPTLPPYTPIERFSDGCFICQPTVFFRRTLPLLLGKLEEELKTAFDFDYWLRAFLAFPERIGFVDALQAFSRLHRECITQRMRRVVALEGMRVLSRHLGSAPNHWLLTYVEELLAACEVGEKVVHLEQLIVSAIDEATPWMTPQALGELRLRIKKDNRLCGVNMEPPCGE